MNNFSELRQFFEQSSLESAKAQISQPKDTIGIGKQSFKEKVNFFSSRVSSPVAQAMGAPIPSSFSTLKASTTRLSLLSQQRESENIHLQQAAVQSSAARVATAAQLLKKPVQEPEIEEPQAQSTREQTPSNSQLLLKEKKIVPLEVKQQGIEFEDNEAESQEIASPPLHAETPSGPAIIPTEEERVSVEAKQLEIETEDKEAESQESASPLLHAEIPSDSERILTEEERVSLEAKQPDIGTEDNEAESREIAPPPLHAGSSAEAEDNKIAAKASSAFESKYESTLNILRELATGSKLSLDDNDQLVTKQRKGSLFGTVLEQKIMDSFAGKSEKAQKSVQKATDLLKELVDSANTPEEKQIALNAVAKFMSTSWVALALGKSPELKLELIQLQKGSEKALEYALQGVKTASSESKSAFSSFIARTSGQLASSIADARKQIQLNLTSDDILTAATAGGRAKLKEKGGDQILKIFNSVDNFHFRMNDEILNPQLTVHERAAVIERYIHIAHAAFEKGDYETAYTIASNFETAHLARLSNTMNEVSSEAHGMLKEIKAKKLGEADTGKALLEEALDGKVASFSTAALFGQIAKPGLKIDEAKNKIETYTTELKFLKDPQGFSLQRITAEITSKKNELIAKREAAETEGEKRKLGFQISDLDGELKCAQDVDKAMKAPAFSAEQRIQQIEEKLIPGQKMLIQDQTQLLNKYMDQFNQWKKGAANTSQSDMNGISHYFNQNEPLQAKDYDKAMYAKSLEVEPRQPKA